MLRSGKETAVTVTRAVETHGALACVRVDFNEVDPDGRLLVPVESGQAHLEAGQPVALDGEDDGLFGLGTLAVVDIARGFALVDVDWDSVREPRVDVPGATVRCTGGQWIVKYEGRGFRKAIAKQAHLCEALPTQAAAVARARQIIRTSGGGELIVHGLDGTMKSKSSVPSAIRKGAKH